MQSEEPTIIQSLENHLAEYGHTTVGQDIAAAILVIKDLHQKAALSAAEPVAELQSVDARELDEAIKLLPSVMRPSLSKVIISAIEEQRRIISYFKRTSNARQLAFDAALSAQVQDVAEPDFSYRIEYDYRSYVEKKTMWGLYRELGVVALEEAQEALRTAQQNNAVNFRISRKPVVKWEPLPAAPARQEGKP